MNRIIYGDYAKPPITKTFGLSLTTAAQKLLPNAPFANILGIFVKGFGVMRPFYFNLWNSSPISQNIDMNLLVAPLSSFLPSFVNE